MNADTPAPDPRSEPRAFLEHLYRAAVQRALPLHNTAAFLPPPPKGRTLEDKQRINKDLLNSGASISEMNCVRKHLSRIKGGRLAAACAPAQVVTLTISDVPGDDPSIIASGPTVPDATSCAQAIAIL